MAQHSHSYMASPPRRWISIYHSGELQYGSNLYSLFLQVASQAE